MQKNFNKRFGTPVQYDSIPFTVNVTEQVSRTFTGNIFGYLEELSDIEQVLFILDVAEENDFVRFRLNSGGGSVHVGDTLIDAMRKCRAQVFIEASGTVASFATFILLEADDITISEHCEFLLHSCYYGVQGKMADVKREVEFTHQQAEKILRSYYKDFLTEEEITDIIENKKEMLMTAQEFADRYEKRAKIRVAQSLGQIISDEDEIL